MYTGIVELQITLQDDAEGLWCRRTEEMLFFYFIEEFNQCDLIHIEAYGIVEREDIYINF